MADNSDRITAILVQGIKSLRPTITSDQRKLVVENNGEKVSIPLLSGQTTRQYPPGKFR